MESVLAWAVLVAEDSKDALLPETYLINDGLINGPGAVIIVG